MPAPRATQPPAPDIVGRALELEAVDRFLASATTAGAGIGALLVEGEAGVGKSMLSREAVARARARGLAVLACAPAAVEQGLSFVALRDLLADLPEADLDRLPPPQGSALGSALLRLPAGGMVDPGALGVALTAVLRRRAEDRPMLLAIDDSQWLDPPSARVLAFALRRLGDARLRVLATRRSGEEAPFVDEMTEILGERVERIRLGPISFGALHHLLTTRTGHRFARPVVARIERASGGNPMTAIEIGRALLESGAHEPAPGQDLPVPERLRDLLDARLARLSAGARASLLLAASLSHPTMALVAAAADDAGATGDDLAEAETAGVITIDDGRVQFSHPLFASVVQAGASAATRRSVHRRLAAVVAGDEERAHHLALAATDPDADLAGQLESAGIQTYHGGAPDLGAELLARARALTPEADVDARARRATREAEARLEAGDLAGSSDVLEGARAWMAPGPRRAEALMLLGTVQSYLDRSKALATLEEALAETRPVANPGSDFATDHGADSATDATLRGRIHSRLALFADDPETSRAHGRKAVALIDPTVNPSGLAFATFGLFWADIRAGSAPDLAAFERALAIEPAVPSWEASTIPALWWSYMDQPDLARARLDRHLQWARDSGDESSDADLYAHLAELEIRAGRWAAADEAATRSVEAAEQMGQLMPDPSHRIRAFVDAHLGRLEAAIEAVEAGAAASRDQDDPELEAMYLDVLGTARLAAGEPAPAVEAFDRMTALIDALGVREPLRHRTEPDHVEALAAIGAVDRAGEVLARLEQRQLVLGRPWIASALPRAWALVRSAGGDAEGAADELAGTLDGEGAAAVVAGGAYAEARTLLVLGRLERRLGRRRSAGERLDRSVELLDALPAPAWASQARAEIDRLGRRRGAGEELTPAETRVVELIAAGLTNRAVAERLVLSPKTVEAHLARAYAKLGVRSRAELGRRMADGSGRAGEADEPAL